jgi:hypothetical protein
MALADLLYRSNCAASLACRLAQEWEAELRYREAQLAKWDQLNWHAKGSLLWHSLGALLDALWLQPRRWEDEPGFDPADTFAYAFPYRKRTIQIVQL